MTDVPEDLPATRYGSCTDRVTLADLRSCSTRLPEDPSPEQLEIIDNAIAEALYLFDNATNWQLRGPCVSMIRPLGAAGAGCSPGRDEILDQVWPSYLPPMLPYVVERVGELGGPTLVNCWYSGSCSDPMTSIRLPWTPVRSVLRVQIGTSDLDANKWRLVDGTNLLLRIDGHGFPTRQDITKPLGQDGTWGVEFVHGPDVPPGGVRRIAQFAAIIAGYCLGDSSCKLPENARIVRTPDGVEFMVVDNYRDKGLTGYQPLDDWISSWRHATQSDGATRRPRMYRPGSRRFGAGPGGVLA